MERVLVILGPTAVGKTALSIALATRFNGEIINGDSVQVYKELNIGSAKIKEEEKAGIIHHLLDIRHAGENFSVADFQALVRARITEITQKGKLAVICGGTGLYIEAALFDYHFTSSGRVDAFSKKYESYTNEDLFELLKKRDPQAALNLHMNNRRRVLRALEIYENADMTKTAIEDNAGKHLLYDACIICLDMDRKILYDRINQRVDIMLKEGLLEEAKQLYDRGIEVSAIGYKELNSYFRHEETLVHSVELIKQHTRNYAKRQLTYFRNRLNAEMILRDAGDFSAAAEEAAQIVSHWLEK